jgi:hypothetical protein
MKRIKDYDCLKTPLLPMYFLEINLSWGDLILLCKNGIPNG